MTSPTHTQAGGLKYRGRTEDEILKGNYPEAINISASADGGKLQEHSGFILALLCLTDYEMLVNLGLVDRNAPKKWTGVQSAMSTVCMGFFQGNDDHDNNVKLLKDFLMPLQKLAASTDTNGMFNFDGSYFNLNISIVHDKKELQMCSESGGGTYLTYFPCTYCPINNTQMKDPAPYRCSACVSGETECFHWSLLDAKTRAWYCSSAADPISEWSIPWPSKETNASGRDSRLDFVVGWLQKPELAGLDHVTISNTIRDFRACGITEIKNIEGATTAQVATALSYQGIDVADINPLIVIVRECMAPSFWCDFDALNGPRKAKELLKLVIHLSQACAYCRQISPEKEETCLVLDHNNHPPCILHAHMRLYSKYYTTLFQFIKELKLANKDIMEQVNVYICQLMSLPASKDHDVPIMKEDPEFTRTFQDTIVKVGKGRFSYFIS